MERPRPRRSDLFGEEDKGRRRNGAASASAIPEVPDQELRELNSGFTTIKTFVIFAVIFACFALVYPRFIHPVVIYAYYGQSPPGKIPEEKFLPPKFHKGAIHPGINTGAPRSNMHDRPLHHPGARFTGENGYVPESKGSLYFMLPLYTVGIIAFLLYTFYKVLSRQPMKCVLRPEQVRYCSTRQQFTNTAPVEAEIDRISALLSQQPAVDAVIEGDAKITEFQLQALESKLKETEAQMNALIAQMAMVKSVEEMVKKAEIAVESDLDQDEGGDTDGNSGSQESDTDDLRLIPDSTEEESQPKQRVTDQQKPEQADEHAGHQDSHEPVADENRDPENNGNNMTTSLKREEKDETM